jgi:uncharacterized protein (TIGR03067 family)
MRFVRCAENSMNIPVFFLLSSCLVLVCQTTNQPAAQPLSGLQGEWALVSTANEHRPDRGSDCIRMLIRDSRVSMKFAGRITNQGTLAVGPRMGTNTIDMKFANGRCVQGVYVLQGSTLVICVDEAGNGRPDTLTPKGTQWSETWKRVNP